MNKVLINGLVAVSLAFSGSALALDMSATVLCASIDVHECVDGGGCAEVTPEAVGAPTFFRLDLKKKLLIVRQDEAPNKAEVFEDLDGRIMMQGVAEGRKDVVDGVAWTITVEKESARMVATATTQQAAIVIFGACTEN
jgi:hypothetical protein